MRRKKCRQQDNQTNKLTITKQKDHPTGKQTKAINIHHLLCLAQQNFHNIRRRHSRSKLTMLHETIHTRIYLLVRYFIFKSIVKSYDGFRPN